ncbi:MAG TPA: HAD family phosphatase [Candidatus Saccharimonadales bacterium]|nr:HAD family phosphatase [Candidatus Saccharimonadales bacterium]
MKKFAVFDIDGTLIRWQLYHAIADALVKLGFVDASAYDSMRGARMAWKRREAGASFKSYEAELIRTYEQVLRDLTTEQFESAAKAVFEEYRDQVYIYTRGLITELKSNDYLIFAISGSQAEIVKLMAAYYGFDDFVGTSYERSGDKFSGKRTFYAAKKDVALKSLAQKHGVTFKGSIAVGDSKSDAAMLELVERPIAFNPDADLYKIAREHGWEVVLERKNMVYELKAKDGRYQLDKTNAD